MALITGTPLGNVQYQENLFMEGAPTIFIQDATATELNHPDSDGFYWGLSGTSTYPVYEIGCLTAVTFTENLTMNDVLCDNVGVKDTIMQRNYFEFNFTLLSFFPFSTLTKLLQGGTVTTGTGKEKMPLGKINNAQYWHVYAPKVYDESVGDYVVYMLHRVKFVDAFTINMPFGNRWEATGLKMRSFVDSNMPAAQQFGALLRFDLSALP